MFVLQICIKYLYSIFSFAGNDWKRVCIHWPLLGHAIDATWQILTFANRSAKTYAFWLPKIASSVFICWAFYLSVNVSNRFSKWRRIQHLLIFSVVQKWTDTRKFYKNNLMSVSRRARRLCWFVWLWSDNRQVSEIKAKIPKNGMG